jgi:hypothetical protein
MNISRLAFLLGTSFVFAFLPAPLLFAGEVNSHAVVARNGAELIVPDGERWILKKESLKENPVKLYVSGVFYVSEDVVAQVTPPTDLAPSKSALLGDGNRNEVELAIPNGSDYDIYFLGGTQIRVESKTGPLTFFDSAPQ